MRAQVRSYEQHRSTETTEKKENRLTKRRKVYYEKKIPYRKSKEAFQQDIKEFYQQLDIDCELRICCCSGEERSAEYTSHVIDLNDELLIQSLLT